MFELLHKSELISEEKRPSLYSLSLTDSICSDSTIDLDELNQTGRTIKDFNTNGELEPKPLENNFVDEIPQENNCDDEIPQELAFDKQTSEIITPEPLIVAQSSCSKFGKSVSLHDVSNILPLHLTVKSNTVSSETIHSQSLSSTTKSKDSGIQRSVSCLSLASGKRNYDHVQSKVKAYIQNIKESQALRKKNRLLQKHEVTAEAADALDEFCDDFDKEDLIIQIQELKHELHEKSLYIDAQQRNFNRLMLKLAEARNTINDLRVQHLSLNYSSVNDSKNQSSLINNVSSYNDLIAKLSTCQEEESAEKNVIVSLETTTNRVSEDFQPRNHSSPYDKSSSKSLSPVSKICSSSSRLDKNYKPLTNLKKKISHSQAPSYWKKSCSEEQIGEAQNINLKLNNNSNLVRRQSTSIDLPNDDPFDKVKKWQASLPSINLLGTYSSSDCDEVDKRFPQIQSDYYKKKTDVVSLTCNYSKNEANESEICNSLSQELKTKCRISDMEVDSLSMKDNQHSGKELRKEKRINSKPALSNNTSDKEPNFYLINNRRLAGKNIPPSAYLKECNRTSVSFSKGNSVKDNFSSMESTEVGVVLQSQKTNYVVPEHSRESSSSESDTETQQPKSSVTGIDKIMNDNSESDDSSSISSSVLGSDTPSLITSPKRTKRRLAFSENKISSKVPKMTKSKSSQTAFVMREPKFNFTAPFENNRSQMNNQISSKNKSEKYETWFKYRNSKDCCIKTESSQRKAWNDRNNTNFYVCKDFSFKQSSSLQECISHMEGLVSKGSAIIETAMGRSSV